MGIVKNSHEVIVGAGNIPYESVEKQAEYVAQH
jgi:hypothetical protein